MNKEQTNAKNRLLGYKYANDAEKMLILYGISNSKAYGVQKEYLLNLIEGLETKDNKTALNMWLDTYNDLDKIFEHIIAKLKVQVQLEKEK